MNTSFAWSAPPPSPAGGNYLALDGADDYAFLDFGIYGLLFQEGTNNLTVEAWIYPTEAPDDDTVGIVLSQQVVIYTVSYNNPKYQEIKEIAIWEKGDLFLGMRVYVPPFGGNDVCVYTGIGGLTISPYQWHHIAFQIAEREMMGFFDDISLPGSRISGIEQNLFKDCTGYGKRTRGDLVIGGYGGKEKIAWPFPLWGSFAGYIDEVRISDFPRYNAAKGDFASPGRFEPDDDTIALWHFDEPRGADVFLDSSGNKNHLTGRNGATAIAVSDGNMLVSFWGAIKTSLR